MNFKSKNLIRAGFILAATLSMTSAWAAAQDTSAAPADVEQEEIFGQTTSFGDLMIAEPQPANQWAPISQLTSPNALLDQRLSPAQATSLFSEHNDNSAVFQEDFQQIGRGYQSGPEICRFDYPADRPLFTTDNNCCGCGIANTGQFGQAYDNGLWVCEDCGCDVQGKSGIGYNLAFRLGWWAVDSEGSPVKTGEFQDLESSPFWDLDGISSNGSQTLDFTLSGLDQDANDARAYYYGGPALTVKFDYQRFLHRLDHEPLAAFDLSSGTPAPNDKVVGEDLNVGEDYAIRVQQLDAQFEGRLTRNLKWKVDLWGMRKSGERQANAMAHCFNVSPPPGAANYTCHVLSQRQSIDWTTMEVKPVLEAQVGKAVVEYSRTMRVFGQNDQTVQRTYTAFDYSPAFGAEGALFDYALVPENFTQTDQLKLNVPLDEVNQLYANLYLGDTENKFRGNRRSYNGYDLRLTNRAVEDVTMTAYSKLDEQNNTLPTNLLTSPPLGVNAGSPDSFEPGSLRHPVEYNKLRVGLKGRWRSRAQNWLSVVGGYEFVEFARDFADYSTLSGPFTQEDTRTNQINIGPYVRVSPTLDTFVRYRGSFIDNPLIGVRESDGKFNTNQPEQEHRVEFGGTWSPTSNFMATGMFGVENSWHHSQFADFDEDNYPIVFTLWYAPTARLSLTGGYAYLSNWIDQDITIGFQNNPTETTQWNYGGYNNLFSISANYAYSPRTQLVGGVEWNRGSNVFTVPPSLAGADWSALPTFSDVIVETTRINLGIDHEFRPSMNGYFRYVRFDYDDLSADYNSGTANMFLAGITMLH